MRIALAHDWLVGMRGGERVLERLAGLTGPTELFTMVHDTKMTHGDAIEACRIHTSSMQRWPGGVGGLRRWYLPLYPRAVRSLEIPDGEYDLLISTSSAMIKSIGVPIGRNGRRVDHVCYCHTPARYLWEQAHEYGGKGLTAAMRGLGLKMVGSSLRRFDVRTSEGVTQFIANSAHTARRIARVYGREAAVIHPPVDIGFYTVDSGVSREDFYLVVSALEPYKRVDLAVRAALENGLSLRIAGSGSERARLEKMAGRRNNIEFLGMQGKDQLRTLYRGARALLFPGMEDFGIVPVEAMACGCPVIAYDRGGAEDWFGEGCGVLFGDQDVSAMIGAITKLERGGNHDEEACRAQAERFGAARFDEAICRLL